MMQEPRDGHLLLVATRQFGDSLARTGAADAEPIDPARRGRELPRRQNGKRRSERLEARERHVVGDAQAQRQSLAGSVLAQQPHSLTPSIVRRRRPRIRADDDRATRDRLEAEDGPEQTRTSRSEKAGDAEDLAAVQRERRRTRHDAIELEYGRADGPRAARVHVVQRPPHHHADDVGGAGGCSDAIAGVTAVA